MAKLVIHPTSAHVIISRFVSWSPTLGEHKAHFQLYPNRVEPAWDSPSLPLSLSKIIKINKERKKEKEKEEEKEKEKGKERHLALPLVIRNMKATSHKTEIHAYHRNNLQYLERKLIFLLLLFLDKSITVSYLITNQLPLFLIIVLPQ